MSNGGAFSISQHAVRRMMQRGVSLTHVARTLRHPDRVEPDRDDPGLMHAVKRFHRPGGSSVLHVLYNHFASPWRVVTVYWERRTGRKP